jgi:TetR/AcrR family transcriptional regulator, regulator of autoinduction and epiphytic fitness
MANVMRPYRSPRRREQAEETRRRILAASRRLFVQRGYGGTTIESIAEAAGVAVQTVYASFGSKQGILLALLDEMAADADLARMQAAVAAATGDPRRQLREQIAFTCRFYRSGADLIDIARTVSGVEPDLRAMWQEGEGRRHRSVSALVAEWEAADALAPGLTAKQATDVMWALGGPDVFRLFTVERRWSKSRFEAWLGATLEAQLFGGSPG